MLAKLILFHSTVQIAVVLLIRKRMGLFFIKNHLLRCFYCFSLLNWIVALILSLLLKLPPRKLAPWFILWRFFLLRLLFIFMNIPSALAWNTVVMSGLEAPIDTWIFWINCRNGYVEILVLHLLFLLTPWLIFEM